MNKRLVIGIILGAILGVACVVGARLRYDTDVTNLYVVSFWFNRVLIGLVIGLLSSSNKWSFSIMRGLFAGLIVSFAFYSATEFFDPVGFVAGAIYGIIIESVLLKMKL